MTNYPIYFNFDNVLIFNAAKNITDTKYEYTITLQFPITANSEITHILWEVNKKIMKICDCEIDIPDLETAHKAKFDTNVKCNFNLLKCIKKSITKHKLISPFQIHQNGLNLKLKYITDKNNNSSHAYAKKIIDGTYVSGSFHLDTLHITSSFSITTATTSEYNFIVDSIDVAKKKDICNEILTICKRRTER